MSKKLINSFRESVIRDITTFGGLPFFGAVILFLFFLGNQIFLLSQLIIGLIIIIGIAVIIRSFYYKPRPKELTHNSWLERMEASSFPSIHAARAWFLVFVFGNYFQNTGIWALLSTAAIAICYSRLHMKRHDVWDLAAGTVLAIICYIVINIIH